MRIQSSDTPLKQQYTVLKNELEGDLFIQLSDRLMYATDASAYRELPQAVAYPKSKEDIRKLIFFACENI